MSKRRGAQGNVQEETIHFFGREFEAGQIVEALGKKKSMMISGPADIGKTTLMRHVLCGPKYDRSRYLYLAGFKDLQELLRKILRILYQDRVPALRQQLRAEKISGSNFEDWLKAKPSPRLKGTVYRAIENNDYRLILDHVPSLTPAIAKFIKELFWMRDTPVYMLTRDEPRYRLNQLSHFFHWGRRERLVLGPLPERVAAEMLEGCIRRFDLTHFDLDGFRDEILDLSGCVPGAIVKMCALAADPRYQNGLRIKTKLMRIDYLMNQPRLYP